MEFPDKELYRHKINNDYYYFKVVLYTANGTRQTITPTAIKSFVLEDNFYDFFHKGYLIIDNKYDVIERSIVTDKTPDPTTQFIFMGDARDWIDIQIMPMGENNELLVDKAVQHLSIFLQAAIYDVEDIPSDTPDVKYKKLYFWDKYYEYMCERNTAWSTAEVIDNVIAEETPNSNSTRENAQYYDNIEAINNLQVRNVTNFSNDQRRIPTGEAIKKFLASVFKNENDYPIWFPGSNFTGTGEVTKSDDIIADDTHWDIGATTIFFSAPARFKAIDSLNYLIDRHVSNANSLYDQCFLRIDRAKRCFTFRSLFNIFKTAYIADTDSAGPSYIETVKLGGLNDEAPIAYTKVADFTPKNAIQLTQSGTTNNFTLESSVGALTQSKINSKIVHSYDLSKKQFNIDNNANSMGKTMETFQKNFVESIKPNRWTNIVPGITRMKNRNVEHVFTIVDNDPIQRISFGRHDTLYACIFANNQVKFKAQGSTARQAGKFMGVDRDGSSPFNAFDEKFLGIYFVTEVKHVFEGNNYYNEVTCTKTYTDVKLFQGQVGPGNQDINNQVII